MRIVKWYSKFYSLFENYIDMSRNVIYNIFKNSQLVNLNL